MKIIKNWEKFNEDKENLIVFEMTGSPRDAMSMLEPKDRTKEVFAHALSKFGYIHGRLNQDCDLLVAKSKDIWTIKMKKAEEYNCEVTTYDELIKKYNLFEDKKIID